MKKKSLNVVIVDDHTLFRSGLKMLLEAQPDISVACEYADAATALEEMAKYEADIVLLDITLPGIDGLKAAKLFKEQHPRVKVIMLTMHNDEPYLLKALEAGAAGYVLKEAASTELVSAIHAVAAGDVSAVHPSLVKVLVNKALHSTEDDAQATGSREALTAREREVLALIGLGYTNREIGEKLVISIKTVEKHKANIMEKLEVKHRHELVKYAFDNGLISLDER